MAQDSAGAAKRRGPGRPFPKGASGNPGGRPKGLMRFIREATRDGEELARFVLRVFRGEVPGARLSDRMQAVTWLADRGFGKPVQAMEHEGLEKLAPVHIQLVSAIPRPERPATT